jgi:tetratricopeptide (TPR) repeat protein
MRRPLLMLLLCGCATTKVPTPPVAPVEARPAAPLPPTPPRLEGLGSWSRPVSHATPEAQQWFDQGLALVFGFNHDESIRSFGYASALSKGCAMCRWGVAYANGPHINVTEVPVENARAAIAALKEARTLAAEPVEQALIAALEKRYADPSPTDRAPLDQAFAEAMRGVHRAFPKDPDVAALTAEALMDLHPWDLFTPKFEPQPWTAEILSVIDDALALAPKHPLANHLLIHALEASKTPERAQASADLLRDLQPGLGHQVHMPSHLDVRTGEWERAVLANDRAIAADERYRQLAPKQGNYALYMVHNHQMKAWATMMSGRGADTLAAMKQMLEGIPPEFRKASAGAIDPYFSLPMEALMRFGKWDELLAVPEPAEDLPATRAFWHLARGVAFAAKRDVPHALEEQTAYGSAAAKVPAKASMGNNPVAAVLAVGERLLAGELLYAQHQEAKAFEALRRGVELEDALRYDEPPDWMQPVRHALGAALMQSKKFAEAEQVFREDLAHTPRNGWSLFGLGQALRLQGKKAEAATVEKDFAQVWSKADVTLHSACLCQPGL